MHGPYRVIKNAPFDLWRYDGGTTLDISKDGGALTAVTDAPVETPAASGAYISTLTVAEMGADVIFYRGTNTVSLDTGFLYTEPCRDSGVAQAGGSNTIQLRAAAPVIDYTNLLIEIVRGTGKDQSKRLITSFDTGTLTATVRPNWAVTPDNTSVYIITELPKVNVMQEDGNQYAASVHSTMMAKNYKTGTIGPGSTTTVVKTNMTGYGTNAFVGSFAMCEGATNQGIAKPIIGYNTANGDITVSKPFPSPPANGETLAVFGAGG